MPNSIDQMAQTWVQCNRKVLGGIRWGDLDCLGHCIRGGRLQGNQSINCIGLYGLRSQPLSECTMPLR